MYKRGPGGFSSGPAQGTEVSHGPAPGTKSWLEKNRGGASSRGRRAGSLGGRRWCTAPRKRIASTVRKKCVRKVVPQLRVRREQDEESGSKRFKSGTFEGKKGRLRRKICPRNKLDVVVVAGQRRGVKEGRKTKTTDAWI